MATHKPKRGSPALDMTAMVDVAFLLLTFFILTTTRFREDQAVQINAPSSISETKAPEKQVMTLLVSDSSKVFVGFSDIPTRAKALDKAIELKYLSPMTDAQKKVIVSLESFGVPFAQMDAWTKMSAEERKKFTQPGMSAVEKDTVNHTGNELKAWIECGRMMDTGLRFIIKGDGNANFETVSEVLATLQDMKLNKFNLATNLEGKGSAEGQAAAAGAKH
ncbi:MAG: ExbD/TolR family protein [Bacteroidia bacterium]